MYSDDVYYALPLMTSNLGHVSQQGNPLSQTTVSPADLFLTQPSHGPTQSYAIPHVDVASTGPGFGGYPAVDNTSQWVPPCNPLAQLTPFMSHFTVTNDVPQNRFTGLIIPVGPVSRGSSIGCEWVLEDSSKCGERITEGTVPEHLAEHGIRGMHKDLVVQCRWRGCGAYIKRQSITRHVREVHLGLKRQSHKQMFPLALTAFNGGSF